MSELKQAAQTLGALLSGRGIARYVWTVSQTEKQEMNIENGAFKLMRTVFNNTASLKVFLGSRIGAASGNDLTPEGLEQLVADGVAAAESSPEDPCHDFAPCQGSHVFHQGPEQPDMERFISRIREFLSAVEKEYPLVRVMSAIGSYDRWHTLSGNTNGSSFEQFGGQYNFMAEICASDGEHTTGIDGAGAAMADLDTPLMDLGDIRTRLDNIQRSLNPAPLEGKFEGTVILTPACVTEFLYMTLNNFAGSSAILDGTGLWLNKVGQQVASEQLTVGLRPFDKRLVMGERVTQDGFLAEEVTLLDKGVLQTHWLNLYAANKTGRPVVKNTGFDLVVEPGDQTLEQLIASVDRGLILGGFSGGQPGANGEFSGVAKNSFLVEKGRVTGAVTEAMVNGNLEEVLRRVRGITAFQCCDGTCAVPYVAVDGIVISGK